MMLVVALAMIPLGLYTGFLGWLAFHEPEAFRTAPALPASGAVVGTFYRTEGVATGAFLTPTDYPEVKNALQYQVSKERQNDSDDGWTQIAVVAGERIAKVRIGSVPVAVTHATRVLGDHLEALRPLPGRERIKISWTPGGGESLIAYGTYTGQELGDGRYQRVFLASPEANKELLDIMEQSGWFKALVLGVVAAVSLLMAGFAVRSALKVS